MTTNEHLHGHRERRPRRVRATLLSLGAVAAAVEQRRARLSDDEAEALALALRDVLPDHPGAAADLAGALAAAGQPDLSQAIQSLISTPALTV